MRKTTRRATTAYKRPKTKKTMTRNDRKSPRYHSCPGHAFQTLWCADAQSVRFYRYSDLGLDSEPNVGDNGVHASASPFEGLFERMNWVGADIESDGFGKVWSACDVTQGPVCVRKPWRSRLDAGLVCVFPGCTA